MRPTPNPLPSHPAASAAARDALAAQTPSGPWWKYGHMWLVVGGPLIVVIAGFVTLWLAIRTPDPVYSDADRLSRRNPTAARTGDEHGRMAPAMQARNHAATGGAPRAAVPVPPPASDKQP